MKTQTVLHRSPLLMALCVGVGSVCVLVSLLSLRSQQKDLPVSPQENEKKASTLARSSLLDAQLAIIKGDRKAAEKLCSPSFLRLTSGLNPGSDFKDPTFEKVDWSKSKRWCLQHRGKLSLVRTYDGLDLVGTFWFLIEGAGTSYKPHICVVHRKTKWSAKLAVIGKNELSGNINDATY